MARIEAMRRGDARAVVLAAVLSGCGPIAPPDKPTGAGAPPVLIVATERGAGGGHLVILDEDGRRRADLTAGDGTAALHDAGAAFSPDGAWVVFASNRGRATAAGKPSGEHSLWIVAARAGATPRRLTHDDAATDLDPVFMPDGRHIVYASIRRGGTSLDLWRVGVDLAAAGGPVLVGAPEQLTDSPDNEAQPSPSPRGDAIAYVRADDSGSTVWILPLAGGEPHRLTSGPADMTPAWSPRGDQIAYASARIRDLGPTLGNRLDADLFVIPAAGGAPVLVVDEPRADETGPRWSRDGRFLFATGVVRKTGGGEEPLLHSVVFVDLSEQPRRLRALHDPAYVETRLDPAVAGGTELDALALQRNPDYWAAVKAALRQYWEQHCRELLARDPDAHCN